MVPGPQYLCSDGRPGLERQEAAKAGSRSGAQPFGISGRHGGYPGAAPGGSRRGTAQRRSFLSSAKEVGLGRKGVYPANRGQDRKDCVPRGQLRGSHGICRFPSEIRGNAAKRSGAAVQRWQRGGKGHSLLYRCFRRHGKPAGKAGLSDPEPAGCTPVQRDKTGKTGWPSDSQRGTAAVL